MVRARDRQVRVTRARERSRRDIALFEHIICDFHTIWVTGGLFFTLTQYVGPLCNIITLFDPPIAYMWSAHAIVRYAVRMVAPFCIRLQPEIILGMAGGGGGPS